LVNSAHSGPEGATVVLGARRKVRLDAIVEDIEAIGGKAQAVTADGRSGRTSKAL